MLTLAAIQDSLEGLRRRKASGVDVQPAARPEQPPAIQAGPGSGIGGAIGQLGAAVVGRLSQKAAPAAPSFSSAADSARMSTPGFVGGQGAMTAPGTNFVDTKKLDLENVFKPKTSPPPFVKPPVQMFAHGGTLRKPGEVAIVGEEGPEVAVRGKNGVTHVIPMSAVQEALSKLGQPPPIQPQSQREDAPAPGGLPLSMLDSPRPSPTVQGDGVLTEGSAEQAQTRPRTVAGGVPLSVLDGLRPPAPGETVDMGEGGPEHRARVVNPAGLLSKRLEDAQANPAPFNTNSKAKGMMLSGLHGALRGLAATGTLAGAAGGAGAGALGGVFDEKLDERLRAQDFEIPQLTQRVAQTEARQDRELERAGRVAGVRKTLAEATDIEGRPARARAEAAAKARKDAIDTVVRIYNDLPEFDPDAADAGARELAGQANALGVPLLKKTRNEPLKYEYDDAGRLMILSGGKFVDFVKGADGQPVVNRGEAVVMEDGLPVKPGTALTARAAREERLYQRERDARRDVRDDARDTYLDEKAAYDLTGQRVESYNALVDEGEAARVELLGLSDLQRRLVDEGKELPPEQQTRLAALSARHDSIVKQLAAAEAAIDPAHAAKDAAGRFRMKTAPRRPKPQPGATGGAHSAPPMSEGEYVEHARKTIPNFDEAKARAAYRSRYGGRR